MKLVLDTSALIYIVEEKIDVDQLREHELFAPTAVVKELEVLSARNRKARAALQLLRHLNINLVELEGPADNAVLQLAKRLGAVLVTGDAQLAKKAKIEGVPVGKFHKKELVFI